MKLSGYIALVVLCTWTSEAQQIKPPAEMTRPITEEQRADSPIPALPEAARPMTKEELKQNEKDFAKFEGAKEVVDSARAGAQSGQEGFRAVREDIDAAARAHGVEWPEVGRKPAAPPAIEEGEVYTNIDSDAVYADLKDKMVIVFIGNVAVRNPDYSLDCDDQLQVFLHQSKESKAKQEERAKKNAEEEKEDKGSKNPFGDSNLDLEDGISKAVAYGNVHIKNKGKDGEWMEAFGQRATYNGLTGEVILTGGYPWVVQDSMVYRMKSENGVIRILDGKISTDGPASARVKPAKFEKKK